MNQGWLRSMLGILLLVSLSACGDDAPGGTDADVGPTPEAGAEGGPGMVQPIEAEPQTWTWVDFPNSRCGNGEPTGIGVSLNPDSDRLYIFLEGGGACWNEVTCYGGGGEEPIASNISDGYDAYSFELDLGMFYRNSFARTDMDNPLRDYNMVYVPYCTGDVHSGDNIAMHGGRETHHAGGANVSAFMERVAVTLPDVEYVVLAGRSAGGFGSLGAWNRVKAAFPEVRVDMFNASGPAPPAESIGGGLYDLWRAAWGYDPMIPADCDGCAGSLDRLFGYYADRYPDHRFALTSYSQDAVIASFFNQSIEEFEVMLKTILRTHFTTRDNLHYFVTPGDLHTMLGAWTMVEQNGVTVRDWMGQMISDDASWTTIEPEGFLAE